MFRRPVHQSVLAVLGALRADFLASCRFLFGGGTRIVLQLDEFRESRGVDFLCSDAAGYAELRLAAVQHSYAGLFENPGEAGISFPRELRVDQYGIRFPLICGEQQMKVALFREARITLDPGVRPEWSPVECLSLTDCFAETLLALSDRWADRQIFSRDLIDLAVLRARVGPIPLEAWSKAEAAYKTAPRLDLEKALAALEEDSEYRERSFAGLRIEDPTRVAVGLTLLRQDLGG